jgi:hypothetical protein
MLSVYNNSDSDSEQDDILEHMKSKNDLNTIELSIYLLNIVHQLIKIENLRINNTNDYFDSVKNLQDMFNIKKPEELINLYNEQLSDIKNYFKNDKSITQEREMLNEDINNAISHYNTNNFINDMLIILKNKNEDIMIKCEYKNLCVSCKNTSIYNTPHDKSSHCYNCSFCDDLRICKEKHEKKRVKKILIKQLDEEYNKKNPSKLVNSNKKNKIRLKNEKININNNYIQININQTIFNQPVVISKDRFFEVFINDIDNNIDNIKRVFIYYMCRSKAIQLFPGEKHNKVNTFPLSAGLYTIKDNVLHGILRYKHTPSSRINVNKLQNIIKNDKINIVANELKYVNNIKDNHCIEEITNVINSITLTNSYGSNLEDFYKHD